MANRPKGDPLVFAPQQRVRYRPGNGTYGYESAIEDDGRIPAMVVGVTPTRVRVEFTLNEYGVRRRITRAVDAASLVAA